MQRIFGVFVVLVAAGLAACGGESSAAEGTWTLDTDALFTSNRATIQGMMPPGGDEAMMKEFEEGFRRQIQGMKATITLKGDHTYASAFSMPGAPSEDGSGTWTMSGDTVTIQPKVKNGKKVEGEKAWSLTLKDGTLTGKPDPNVPLTLVLRRG
jgi:hypothetical protein